MFYVGSMVAGLLIGLALLTVGGVITHKKSIGHEDNIRRDVKLFLMVIGFLISILIILFVYDDAGKPINFSTNPGYYEFYLTGKNTDTIAGVVISQKKGDGRKSVEKFVVIPRGAISNNELLEKSLTPPAVLRIEVIEEVKGYKRIILRP